jgi:hypothetical protein
MCSEFILAILYFSTIFIVNLFLYKLLKIYIKEIFYLLKLNSIFQVFKKPKNNFISLLYYFSKKDVKKINFLKNLKDTLNTQDLIIIGNTFSYLSEIKKTNLNYYFFLLKNQYLSMDIELKNES